MPTTCQLIGGPHDGADWHIDDRVLRLTGPMRRCLCGCEQYIMYHYNRRRDDPSVFEFDRIEYPEVGSVIEQP